MERIVTGLLAPLAAVSFFILLLILVAPPMIQFVEMYWSWWDARLRKRRLAIEETSYRDWKKTKDLKEEMKGEKISENDSGTPYAPNPYYPVGQGKSTRGDK